MSIPLPSRRWFRFSLRAFLIFVTLFCIWAAWWMHSARRQKEAVAAVREHGGWLYYDFHQYDPDTAKSDPQAESPLPAWLIETFGVDMFHRVEAVNLVYNDDSGQRLDNQNFSDEIIPQLEAFPSLRSLCLHKTQVTDETMPHIGKLRKLESLFVWNATGVSDEGVAHLAPLKRLKYVHISEGQLGNNSLAILSRLPNLGSMSLQGNRFSNQGLVHLKNMPKLKDLWIGMGSGEITDDGAEHLLGIGTLEVLDLQGHPISETMQTALKQMPNLKQLYWSAPVAQSALEPVETATVISEP